MKAFHIVREPFNFTFLQLIDSLLGLVVDFIGGLGDLLFFGCCWTPNLIIHRQQGQQLRMMGYVVQHLKGHRFLSPASVFYLLPSQLSYFFLNFVIAKHIESHQVIR